MHYDIFSNSSLKKTFNTSLVMGFFFLCLEGEKVWGDGTYFPENFIEKQDVSPTHAAAAEFTKILNDVPTSPPPSNKKEPSQPIALTQPSESQKASPHPPVTESILPTAQPLLLVDVPSHPKAQPLLDKEETSKSTPNKEVIPVTPITYSSIAKGRAPLATVDTQQDIQNQQWYLFACAKRASGAVEIVTIGGGKELAQKADQVKKVLVEKGLDPEQIRIITIKAEENQPNQIHIFGGI